MKKKSSEWFETWFNSPYYPLLYRHRDDAEAQGFIQKLLDYCRLPKGAHILDLGCGEGRHAIFLNRQGYKVIGIDIAKNRIEVANKKANDTLNFIQADMRTPFPEKYDAIFNLFTSFGYFLDESDDIKILSNIKKALKARGIAVIDFLNTHFATQKLVENEVQVIDSTKFVIRRYIQNGFIIKEIDVEGFHFRERVKCLDAEKMKALIDKVGFQIVDTFGDYQLNPFDRNTSPRLILVMRFNK